MSFHVERKPLPGFAAEACGGVTSVADRELRCVARRAHRPAWPEIF